MVTIKFRRGLSSALPASAVQGEPLFATDTGALYIGTGTSKVLINSPNPEVTSGYTSNGQWVKSDDGTMICTKKVTSTIAISSAFGTLYTSNLVGLGIWPITFYGVPTLTTNCIRIDNAYWLFGHQGLTASACGSIGAMSAGSYASVQINIHVTAIGRWKA